jgi:NTE family protein
MVTTALVLAGGGSFGAVQVGMLKALVASGLRVDCVVGSSVGAINGAYYAHDPSKRGVAQLERIWLAIKRQDVFPVNWRSLTGFVRQRDFLISSDGIRALIENNLPFANLEDTVLPVHVVATDVLSGGPVILSRGSVADAIVASTAIPAAFAPVKIGNRYLMDGAITSNTPVRVAVSLGARRLIVLPTGFACSLSVPPRGAIGNALHALTLLIARQLVAELEGLPPEIDYAIAPSLCPLVWSPYDFGHVRQMIDTAEASTGSWIAAGGLATRVIPDELRAHSHVL